MALTSTELAEILNMTTADGKYAQVAILTPYISVMINDYCNGGFSRQVKEETITFSATGTSSSSIKQLGHCPVVKGTVYITSTDRSTYFYGDTQFGNIPTPNYYIPSSYVRDFELDYSTGGICIPTSDSRIGSTESVLVTYSYVDIIDGGKLAAAKIVEQQINTVAGIQSESIGPLSRSYTGGSGSVGFDSTVRAMLFPYKRVRVI